jgi:hypothetical protein
VLTPVFLPSILTFVVSSSAGIPGCKVLIETGPSILAYHRLHLCVANILRDPDLLKCVLVTHNDLTLTLDLLSESDTLQQCSRVGFLLRPQIFPSAPAEFTQRERERARVSFRKYRHQDEQTKLGRGLRVHQYLTYSPRMCTLFCFGIDHRR